MKKIILLILIIVTSVLLFWDRNSTPLKTTVYISQVIEHPALNATVQGIKDVLKKNNINVQVESAQGNPSLASQIACKFIAQKPKIVVGVGTVSAQSFIKYLARSQTKLIFSSVTDPTGSLPNNPNICGISNFVSLEPQLKLFKKIQPQLKRLGILYNPGELNSVSIVKKLKTIAPQHQLILVEQTINKTSDASQSIVQLSNQCDAIFICNDNTALGAIKIITKLSKVPVYVSDTDAVKLGCVAALGPNQYKIGIQTGNLIIKALKKEKCNFVTYPDKTELYINKEATKKWGLSIPLAIPKELETKS